jgi:hypothetical protein
MRLGNGSGRSVPLITQTSVKRLEIHVHRLVHARVKLSVAAWTN